LSSLRHALRHHAPTVTVRSPLNHRCLVPHAFAGSLQKDLFSHRNFSDDHDSLAGRAAILAAALAAFAVPYAQARRRALNCETQHQVLPTAARQHLFCLVIRSLKTLSALVDGANCLQNGMLDELMS